MSRFFNTLLLSATVFILVFCLLQYYAGIIWISTLTAFSLSICSAFVFFKIASSNKKEMAQKNKKNAQALGVYCCTHRTDQLLTNLFETYGFYLEKIDSNFFLAVCQEGNSMQSNDNIDQMHFDAENNATNQKDLFNENLSDEKDRETNNNLPKKFLVVTSFSLLPIKEDVVAQSLKEHNSTAYVLFITNVKNVAAEKLTQSTAIQCAFWDSNDLYGKLKDKNLLPCLKQQLKQKKISLILSHALNKSRSKYYFTSGIFLLVFSFVTFIPIYTLIYALILLALGFYSKYNKKYNHSLQNEFNDSLKNL